MPRLRSLTYGGPVNSPARRATRDDLPRIASTLGAAFSDYSWTRWTVSEDDHEARVAELQRLYVEHVALPHGAVWVDDEVTAVAVFVPPRLPEPPTSFRERIVALQGDEGRAHQAVAAAAVAAHATEIPADTREVCADAWVLATVGVHPDHRGAGLGSAVIDAGLADLEESTASCTLQTSDERNVAFYERLGFAVTTVVDVPAGPTVWSMLRAS